MAIVRWDPFRELEEMSDRLNRMITRPGAAQTATQGKEVMTVGATVPEMRVEIWSGSHPFYTGKSSFVDTAGRVDKFQRKFGSAGDYFKKGKDAKKAK